MRSLASPALFASLATTAPCVLLLILFACRADATSPGSNFWPDDAEGALSITFDDGMPSQLERAVPVLDRLGLKATFYVNPGYSTDWEKNAQQWRRLALEGHELGNHTDKHPCSCQNDFRHGGDYCLEKLDQKEISRAIDDAERALAALTSQPAEARSFAHPCYNTDIGAGANRTSYVPLVAKRYSAARVGDGGLETGDNDPATVDLSYVYSLGAERAAEDIIAHIEGSLRRGRWAVIVFHGIGAEWNITDVSDFNNVMDYVSKNRKRIWVAPFVQVANYVRAHRAEPYQK